MHPPSKQFHLKLQNGELEPDEDQVALLPELDVLAAAMKWPVERVTDPRVARGRVEVWRRQNKEPIPRGIYLFGAVGRGKSMLMELVFKAAPIKEKRRVHFHPFVQEIHQRIKASKPRPGVDMMLGIASDISAEARLLCFDEFYITDIADAVMLGRLLEALFKCGVTLCATSNWGPDELFQGGINRNSILPLLEIIKKNTRSLDLVHGADWRRQRDADIQAQSHSAAELFTCLTNQTPKAKTMQLHNAQVEAQGSASTVHWFHFRDLCAQNLGSEEYMALCENSTALMLSDVPFLEPDMSDAALRLVLLVDLLYEAGIALRFFSDINMDKLCPEGEAAEAYKRTASRIYGLAMLDLPCSCGQHPGE
ncbi:MAG: cell division protein ZapE [Magnetococcales bacterium]|nr:cell division protein ZapE [Magnetococcales bacterium]